LVQQLALPARAQGGAHWLVGALELAAGRFDVARVAFEQAEQVFLTDDAIFAYTLMARGYVALAYKADPQYRQEGADLLRAALERLRTEGSKDAVFFADQIATADRVLIGD
jgi:cytochrome c-type biogenesis protein CcmH/NrfG